MYAAVLAMSRALPCHTDHCRWRTAAAVMLATSLVVCPCVAAVLGLAVATVLPRSFLWWPKKAKRGKTDPPVAVTATAAERLCQALREHLEKNDGFYPGQGSEGSPEERSLRVRLAKLKRESLTREEAAQFEDLPGWSWMAKERPKRLRPEAQESPTAEEAQEVQEAREAQEAENAPASSSAAAGEGTTRGRASDFPVQDDPFGEDYEDPFGGGHYEPWHAGNFDDPDGQPPAATSAPFPIIRP